MRAIKNNGCNKIEIDMGELNCVGEPYVIDLDGNEFILKYKSGDFENDFGKITLESLAKE